MSNINLTTSLKSDTYIDIEIKFIRASGYKISKVDFINLIFEELNDNSDLQKSIREKFIKTLEKQKQEKEVRLKEIKRGL